jgi:hypothetical protein
MKILTLDINAKEWFDKVNGNSYFSAEIVVNYGMNDSQTIKLPFQYGYGDHYQYMAIEELQKQGLTDKKYLHDLRDDGIIVRTNMQRNCRKKDL